MTKNELRVWALRTHLPDEWWVQIDEEVSDTVVNLDEAFRRAAEVPEAYIIHASHAEDTDSPHWVLMGKESEPSPTDSLGISKWVCARCKFRFNTPDYKGKGPGFVEIAAYLLLIVPGLILTCLRRKRRKPACPHCGATRLLEGNSKAARALLDS